MACFLNLLGQRLYSFDQKKCALWKNLVTCGKWFALPWSLIPENDGLKHINPIRFYKIKWKNMTVTSHTSCKAVMFLPKAGVYIALIICAVNSHFVWVFLFLQNLNI